MFLFLYPAIHDVAFSIKEGKTFSSNNVWLSSFFSFYTFHPFSFSSVDVTGTRRVQAYRVNREASTNSGVYVIAMRGSSFRRFYNSPPAFGGTKQHK